MHTYYRSILRKVDFILDRHIFSYEQYCSVVEKNIVLQESSYYDGKRKLRCLNHHKCKKELGGCKNRFVLRKQEMNENYIEKNTR